MEDRKIITSQETKEAFKTLCAETFPFIQKISELIKKSEISKTAYITIGEDGYLNMSLSGTGWEMSRLEGKGPANIRYSFMEELETPKSAKLNMEEKL